MATRKDSKGRVLRPGESERKKEKRYVYTYLDPLKRRKYIYSTDLMKLREREKQLLKDQLDGLDTYVSGNATLNMLFDRYISLKTDLRESTYSNYVYMYNRFVRDTYGKKKIKEIAYSDIVFFYEQYLMKECNLQVNTVESIHTVLFSAFKLAVRDNIIRNNPCEGALTHIKRRVGRKKSRHALTVEQQRAFIEYVRENPVFCKWETILTVLFGTGARIGEIIGIRWEDLDFEKREISINHSISYISKHSDDYRCSFSVNLPKTESGIRIIPMMEPVYNVLCEEYSKQENAGFSDTEVDGMSGFVFTNCNGNLYNPTSINRAIKRIYEAYNAEEIIKAKREKREPVIIPHFTCHHIRHTFCTRLCERETNVKAIQRIMGHKDVQTTLDIYADVTETIKHEAVNQLASDCNVF